MLAHNIPVIVFVTGHVHVGLVCVRNEYKVSVWTDAHADVTRIFCVVYIVWSCNCRVHVKECEPRGRTQWKDVLALSRLSWMERKWVGSEST